MKIYEDTKYLLDLVDNNQHLPPNERSKVVYSAIKERILKESRISGKISRTDMLFLKGFSEKSGNEDGEIEKDFHQTFGKYLKGEYEV